MITKEIDLGEYIIIIDYDGNGGLEIMVKDELGDDIEAILISNAEEEPEGNDQ